MWGLCFFLLHWTNLPVYVIINSDYILEGIMTDLFNLNMPEGDIRQISSLGLAHIGDAVFELMVRSWICTHGGVTSKGLHKETVKHVAAPAQAKAADRILTTLDESELAVYKRGRNARVNSVPQKANISEYHSATGLETLFGWLYLHGKLGRLNELFSLIMEGENAT